MIRNMLENGSKISDIARDLNMDRKTVRKYSRSKVVPRYRKRKHGTGKIDPYREYIRDRINTHNLSAVRILDEIRKKGYEGSYTTLKRYCHTIRKDRPIRAVIRFETEPGKQAQVDFGEFGRIDVDGVNKKLHAFSYILGYSRYRYVEFTTDISTQSLIRMHLNAFRYTGGIPSEILYDNMKQIVLDRKVRASDSAFNQDFVRFSEYYGFNVRLCYPYRPQTKGKVERTIGFLRGNFFNGRTFSNIPDLNSQCSQWLTRINGSIHATTGKIPADMLKEERLSPIDTIPEFLYSMTTTRRVSRECYVHYNTNRYSVPWKYAGREARVTEQNGILHIDIDQERIDHEILPTSNGISRKKEHFEGLLKAVRDQNSRNYAMDVEKRDLKSYEVA